MRRRRRSRAARPRGACAYGSVLPRRNPPIRGLGPTGSSVYKHTARPAAKVTLKAAGSEVKGQRHGGAGTGTCSVTLAGCWLRCVSGRTRLRLPGTTGRHVVRTWSGRCGPPLPHGSRSALWWRPLSVAPAQKGLRGYFRCGLWVPLPLVRGGVAPVTCGGRSCRSVAGQSCGVRMVAELSASPR